MSQSKGGNTELLKREIKALKRDVEALKIILCGPDVWRLRRCEGCGSLAVQGQMCPLCNHDLKVWAASPRPPGRMGDIS